MKKWFLTGIAGMLLFTAACTPAFMVGKGEKRGVFLVSNSQAKYDMLCASGDLEKVLGATHLSREMKDTFHHYNCSNERSSDKIRELFSAMTLEQRKDIKIAFKEMGYSINGGDCCGALKPTSGGR